MHGSQLARGTGAAAVIAVRYGEFATWSRHWQAEYLTRREWRERCACRLYGYPWWPDPPDKVRDDYGLHERMRCQPQREVIE
jgi:hypothetical protein